MAWLIVVGVISLPVMEIMVWIKSAEWIGAGSTILLSIASFLAGMAILRRQGMTMLLKARSRLEQGELPLQAAFDGLCLSAAGVLLVIPGFLTDVLALLLLLPWVRAGLRMWTGTRLVVMQAQPPHPPTGPVIIEADYEIIEPDNKRLKP
ncbi:MAG: FxsA family protein [Phaeospirillum sp.]|nr:FxsA family protein [Phaeospirillum sp.]